MPADYDETLNKKRLDEERRKVDVNGVLEPLREKKRLY